MRKLLNLLISFVIISTTSAALATMPIEELPEPAANNPNAAVEEILSDPLAEDEIPQIKTEPMSAKIDEASEIKPYDEKNLPKEVPPEPKSEFQKLVGMFLKVMFAVVLCAFVIFFLLLFVRRFYGDKIISAAQDGLQDNLKSSQTDSEALKTFLNKTKNH